jgi:hypothetical protein
LPEFSTKNYFCPSFPPKIIFARVFHQK